MSAFGLARQLNIPRKEAQKYMDLYFERYPASSITWSVPGHRQKSRAMSKPWMAVASTFRTSNSSNGARRAGAERAAINAPMQGTAADIIKRAMIAVDEWLLTEKPRVRDDHAGAR